MDVIQWLAVVAVLSAWAVLAYTIRRWGPGRARRSVRCPTKNKRARLVVEQQEGDFGRLRVTDVTACSLFPDSPFNCDKECLARF